jgi:hypothetical protein
MSKPRPVDDAEIVRLAMDWRHWERRALNTMSPGAMYVFDQRLANEALEALRTALDTRL